MIGKKIKNPHPRSSKAERIKKLTDYLREPESKNGKGTKEKCVYSGARGFVCDDPKLQQSEMISLAMAATRSADTINHYVLSWREGSRPSEAQIEEAVTIFMTECGVEGHMVVYGLHSDTDNFHLHLAINRVNPQTEKAVRINNGFDIEAAHKAVARIVKVQGWKSEENALFFVDDKGVLIDTRGRDRKNREQKPSSRAQDYEQRTGEKSAERIGIETLPEVLKASSNWDEFHTKMSEHGMKYEKKGSGAIIWVGEQAIKASAADRGASLSKLEKRFGEFTESKSVQKLPPPSPPPLKEAFSVNYGWNDYAKKRREYFSEKKSARLELNNHIETEDKVMRERQKTERDTVYGNSDWKGKGVYLNAIRSVVAAQHAGEKAEFREKNKELRGELSRRFVPFPDFESWMRERGDEKGAELWRHRHEPKASVFAPGAPSKVNVDIRAFRHRVDSERGRVDYFRENAKKPSFTDFGRSIDIADWRDESVTLAALQLSAQKWAKGFYVSGNDEYKGMCVKLAVEYGLKILNPELQGNLEKTRAQKREAELRAKQEEQKKLSEDQTLVETKPLVIAEKKTLSEVREETTQMILNAMKDGKAPWQNPEIIEKVGIPQRIPKRLDHEMLTYQGINAIILMTAASVKGYSDPRWLSSADVKDKGLLVRTGEEATYTESADFFKRDEHGKRIIEKDKPVMLEKPNIYTTAMFNVEQLRKNDTLKDILNIFPVKLPQNEPDFEFAEQIVKNTPVRIEHSLNEGEIPKYISFADTISIQPEELFSSQEGYYAEVLHQLSHATGFVKRDNRSGIAERHDKLSKEALEETLRGELASLFIGMKTGLQLEDSHIVEHDYVNKAVADMLENDEITANRNFFVRMAIDANRMTNMVMEWSKEREKPREEAHESDVDVVDVAVPEYGRDIELPPIKLHRREKTSRGSDDLGR